VIIQTIMGIKAPAMFPRPARDQLQWPAQAARNVRLLLQSSFLCRSKCTSAVAVSSCLTTAQGGSNKRPRGTDNGRYWPS
jgi:hypothetical protein